MRWEDALADIEGQFDAARSMELAAEVADRSRREVASLVLRDRLLGSVGHPVEVVTAAGAWAGVLSQVGSDWLLLTAGAGAPSGEEVLVAHAGVLWVAGLGRHTTAPSPLAQRLGLGMHCAGSPATGFRSPLCWPVEQRFAADWAAWGRTSSRRWTRPPTSPMAGP